MEPLDREAVARVDAAGELGLILELSAQLRDALWRVESAALAPVDAPGGMVVAATGATALGGALARAILGDRASRSIGRTQVYGLPSWATGQALVLCASYSGETEETLAAYEAAGALGAPRVVVTTGGRLAEQARDDGVPVIPVPGGMRPRRAVAYMTVAALEVAALCGAGEGLRAEIDVAAAQSQELLAEWGPDGEEDSLAKSLARELHGTLPTFVGAGPTAAVAHAWRVQVNLMARQPCHAAELPAFDHDELAGWEGAAELAPLSMVVLDDTDLHPRVQARMQLTLDSVEGQAAYRRRVASRGPSRTARVLSLVLLGDLVAFYLAVLRGVDPGREGAVDALKSALGHP